MRIKSLQLLIICLIFTVLGCSQTTLIVKPTPEITIESSCCNWENGDSVAGEALFRQPLLAGKAGCVTCHSLAPNVTLVGPSLFGIATTAETRTTGVSATGYLHQSIIMPNEFLVGEFLPQLMPSNYEADLTDEEITDLVVFLLTLQTDN